MVDDQTFEAVPEALPELEAGQYRVRIADLSIDLTKRGWIREEAGYLPPVHIGEVVESRNEEFPVEGRIHGRVHIVDGLERAPRALNMLFTGENTAKLMVRVGPDPTA